MNKDIENREMINKKTIFDLKYIGKFYLTAEYFDKEKMYLKQRQIIWWFLENNLLFESNSIEKNIEILNKYTNDKITY